MKKLFTKPEIEALNLLPVDVITYSLDYAEDPDDSSAISGDDALTGGN